MADRGFGFGQATVWKIESGQRPVRASELVALADVLRTRLVTDLTDEPDATRHTIALEQANAAAAAAYRQVKEAAAAYLETQIQLVFAARTAHDAGFAVSDRLTSWLDVLAEEAVIEARVDAGHDMSEELNDEVVKILHALRSNGYQPALHIEDITYDDDGGPLPDESPSDAS
jgi:hypothetical protein